MQEPQKLNAHRLKILQIIAGALGLQSMAYLLVARTVIEKHLPEVSYPPSLETPNAQFFMLLVAALTVAAVVIPHLLMSRIKTANNGKPHENPMSVVFVANIIRFVLFEAVAAMGMVNSINASDMNFSYITVGIAVAGFAIFFPNAAVMKKYLPRDPNQQNPIGV